MCVNPFAQPKIDTSPVQTAEKSDAEVQAAALAERRRAGAGRGSSSTILSGDSAALNPTTGAARTRTLLGEGGGMAA